jgi:hypothetical protein
MPLMTTSVAVVYFHPLKALLGCTLITIHAHSSIQIHARKLYLHSILDNHHNIYIHTHLYKHRHTNHTYMSTFKDRVE